MKNAAFLFGVILLFATPAGAQANLSSVLPPAPAQAITDVSSPAGVQASVLPVATFAMTVPAEPLLVPTVGSTAPVSALSSSGAATSAPQNTPTVQGVFVKYNWQVNAGYTYFNFHEAKGFTQNLNGFGAGIVYYPRGGKFGAD